MEEPQLHHYLGMPVPPKPVALPEYRAPVFEPDAPSRWRLFWLRLLGE